MPVSSFIAFKNAKTTNLKTVNLYDLNKFQRCPCVVVGMKEFIKYFWIPMVDIY